MKKDKMVINLECYLHKQKFLHIWRVLSINIFLFHKCVVKQIFSNVYFRLDKKKKKEITSRYKGYFLKKKKKKLKNLGLF